MHPPIRLSWVADPVLDPVLPQEGRELSAHGGAVLAVHVFQAPTAVAFWRDGRISGAGARSLGESYAHHH